MGDLKADGYTAESWKAFEAARDTAKRVLDSDKAGQGDVDAALQSLVDAPPRLKKEEAPQVDKTRLQAKYDECRVLKAEDYKTMTWHPFAAALDAAGKVLVDVKATQPQVDEALKALTEVRAGLQKVVRFVFRDVDDSTAHKDDIY